MKSRVLLVDDEPTVRAAILRFLEAHGFKVEAAEDCRTAEAAFLAKSPDVAIVDYSLPDGNALELLPALKAADPTVPVVILTGFGLDRPRRARDQGGRRPVPHQARGAANPRRTPRTPRHDGAGPAEEDGRLGVARGAGIVDPFLGSKRRDAGGWPSWPGVLRTATARS